LSSSIVDTRMPSFRIVVGADDLVKRIPLYRINLLVHENSWKRMNNSWISYLNWRNNELWKIDNFSWKFMKAHKQYLNLKSELGKERTLKNRYFSWKLMKPHEKYLNLTSELGKEWFFKVWYFSWKFMNVHE
jgi:hypothetical protein